MINDYRLEKELGAGFSANVYLATDQKDNQKVALKVFKIERDPRFA